MDWGSCGTLSSTLDSICSSADRILIINQALLAVEYLHGQRITHRDIKPANILVMDLAPPVIKLIDFGLSSDRAANKTFCGTLPYVAPEAVISKVCWYDERFDIWSLGLVGFEILVQPVPISTNPRHHDYFKELQLGYQRMHRLLAKQRPTESYIDLLKRMIQWKEDDRPSASECLSHRCFTPATEDEMSLQPEVRKRPRLFAEIADVND